MESINEIERRIHRQEAFEGFVVTALDALVDKDQDGGCCPECCKLCKTLHSLVAEEDYLTELIPLDMRGKASWWNSRSNCADVIWIRTVWRKTECHTSDISWAQRVSDELIRFRKDYGLPIVHVERSSGLAHGLFRSFELNPTYSPLYVVEAYSVALGFTLEKKPYLPVYR